jgi:hypothetical protein
MSTTEITEGTEKSIYLVFSFSPPHLFSSSL